MKRRFLAVFLALALCVGLMPTTAFAGGGIVLHDMEYRVVGGNLYFDSNIGAIVDCDTSITAADIPSTIGGIPVTRIEYAAFGYCDSLTSVTIPTSVTSIGGDAFLGCDSLTSVTIPTSVTDIGGFAFGYCDSLTSVAIPGSVTSIGNDAFSGCTSLTSVTIGNGVTEIGQRVFEECTSLTSVEIPNSVTSIGSGAFSGCTSLTSVTIPTSVTSIGGSAFEDCMRLTDVYYGGSEAQWKAITVGSVNDALRNATIHGSDGDIDLRFQIQDGILTKYIGPDRNVTIPSSVTSIGREAFWGKTSLTSVTIPTSVTSIGDSAFIYCNSLTDIYYSGSEEQWKAIAISNFYNEPLENATIHYNSARAKFPDLKPNGFYLDAVEWAVANNVTTGKTATTFAPNENCTHAQILTFLWRAAGEPESSAQPPITLKGDEFYYKAVKWAAEKGMIDKNFKPSAACNRAYAVLYIWQAFGKPVPTKASPFTDVPAHWSSAPAAAWAAEKGITTGTSATTFDPNGICNRGQIVTFLYRAYTK